MTVAIYFKRNDTYHVIQIDHGTKTFLGRLELNTHKDIKGLGRVNNITSEGGMLEMYQRSFLSLLEGRYIFRAAKDITPELISEQSRQIIADKAEELNRQHEKKVRETLDESLRILQEIRNDLEDD